ncbi:peptidase M10 [Terrimonas sp. NA20]|uniref:Peptidase M10 n=1 Tax=Terrimonas ginsenosidimutans TaxID=2908004 RepID=A0ABS9KW03_9BACT|nr:peptidase M10 [Terrimonas ginsenosidimutans]MCG2616501.1 peptidase M10 [Terrimonas ginsenosidimutans]
MGQAELVHTELIIHSNIITYGNAADEAITASIRKEIEDMWNAPNATVRVKNTNYRVIFRISASYHPDLIPEEIFENTDPLNNYFRIEEFAIGNISFVDGLNCNTGYFKRDNLQDGSTTAAHEYGHTIGLDHPTLLDIRGQGKPGIMYPRGSIVDAAYQYNPAARAGDNTNGGTMNPRNREVTENDIRLIKLHRLNWKNNQARVGEFSSIWHPDHATLR